MFNFQEFSLMKSIIFPIICFLYTLDIFYCFTKNWSSHLAYHKSQIFFILYRENFIWTGSDLTLSTFLWNKWWKIHKNFWDFLRFWRVLVRFSRYIRLKFKNFYDVLEKHHNIFPKLLLAIWKLKSRHENYENNYSNFQTFERFK